MRGKFLLSYLDYFVYLLTVFSALFILAYINMNDTATKGNVIEPAQFIIECTWSENSRNDIDLWVAGPGDTIVFFGHSDGGLIVLDRDDLGINNEMNGVSNSARREVATIRKNVPGEYTVNVMAYNLRDGEEKPKVTIRKLNPYQEIIEKTVDLEFSGEEKTILSFTIDSDGNVIDKNEDDVPLFNRVKP